MFKSLTSLTIATVLGSSPLFIQNSAYAASKTTTQKITPAASLKPIFPIPPSTKSAFAILLAARNPAVIASMDWSPQADAARVREIQQLAQSYKLQKAGTAVVLPLGESLLKLLLEHAYYLDSLRAYGATEKEFPKLDSSIRAAHASVATHAETLVRQYPRHVKTPAWKVEAVISQLRSNSANATTNALGVLRSNKGGEAARVQVTGLLLDHAKGNARSSFGTFEKAQDLELDALTKAAVTLFAAEASQNKKRAIELHQSAARMAEPFRDPKGKTNPIVTRSVAQSVSLLLEIQPQSIDPEALAFFQSLGASNAAHAYSEQVAIRTAAKQPRQAIAFYEDILKLPNISSRQILFVKHRATEIAVNARDCESAAAQWEQIEKLASPMSVFGSHERAVSTQNICWAQVEKSPSAEAVERFVRLHDLLTPISPSYAQNESWSIKAVDALFRANNDNAAATRADALASTSRSTATQLTALRFAAKSRERILAIPPTPDFKRSRKIGNEEVAKSYILNLDKMAKIGTSDEKPNSAFQASFVLHQMEDTKQARSRFESAMGTYSKNALASQAASYLLEINLGNKDHAYTERIARHIEKLKIKPLNKAHSDLRKIIEDAVWEQATALANNSQHTEAADKYVAFQKEFPNVQRADDALNLASENYLKAKKVDAAITQMEALLSAYPQSPFAKETRWNAAEESKGIKQFQRSAGHYEAFNKSWPKDGLSRKSMYKAGEMQRSANRYAHAATDFEAYLAQTQSKPERVKTAKDIASLHSQFGKSSDAMRALERVITISGSPADEFWAHSKMFEFHLQQGQTARVRASALKLASLKANDEREVTLQTRARFELGKLDADEARGLKPMNSSQLLKASQALLKQYEQAKSNLLAPCEGSSSEWCSVGNYEVSRLAEDVSKILLEVEPPPTINPKEADQVHSMKIKESERLAGDIRNYAEQAEAAIARGVPDEDWAIRIRDWGQIQRGENQSVEPIYK
jgi:TolA-binding protein